MTYFQNFPFVPYRFGDTNVTTFHQNISIYADIFDNVKNNNAFYEKYTIIDGDRPDTLSQRFYGDSKYYMTFYLMNDKIREQGFPLTTRELDRLIKRERNNDVITFNSPLTYPNIDNFKNDDNLKNWQFQKSTRRIAKVIRKDYNLQQLVFKSTGDLPFDVSESIYDSVNDLLVPNTAYTITKEYNSTWRYRNADGDFIDPFVKDSNGLPVIPHTIPADATPLTYYDKYTDENNALKDIVVIKPDVIASIFEQFQNAIRG